MYNGTNYLLIASYESEVHYGHYPNLWATLPIHMCTNPESQWVIGNYGFMDTFYPRFDIVIMTTKDSVMTSQWNSCQKCRKSRKSGDGGSNGVGGLGGFVVVIGVIVLFVIVVAVVVCAHLAP